MEKQIIQETVERAKNGNKEAIESLYNLYSRRVYSLCVRMTHNQVEAEDLTQEIFLRAFQKLHTFRGEAAFSTWLYRLGTNVVLMRLRKKTRPEVSLEEITASNRGAAESIKRTSSLGDPARALVDGMRLRRALDQLPNGFRRMVVMHDIQGYHHQEIASLTGRTVGNSKSQLHKARQRLRELLGEGAGANLKPQGATS